MKQQRVDTGWAWAKKLNIPAGAKLGDTVYLSGICSLDDAGNVVVKGDVYGQSKRTFANIEEALASAGATMADVVKITTYLTDISTYADFAKARTEAFPGGVPASTAVATPALVEALDFVDRYRSIYPLRGLVDGRYSLSNLDIAVKDMSERYVIRAAIVP